MLSILIPTYNYDCTQLAHSLLAQLPEKAEIIVGDDCSPDSYVKSQLEILDGEERIKLIRSKKNLGSAGMRNLLCKEAEGDYLLFIDCDAVIEDARFIEKYIKEMDGAVVCGTVRHPDTLPSPSQSLRWRYEKSAERRFTAKACNQNPYQHFRTFHFLIPRNIMQQIPFNEEIVHSGYEDLLFGKRLEQEHIPVRHSEINATNGDIEDNKTFLRKTEGHIKTLVQLRKDLTDYSTLLYIYNRIKKFHLLWALRWLFMICKNGIKNNLQSERPCIKLFQFYKLGLLEEEMKRQKTN